MHWIFSLSSWLKCSQSLSESLAALLKIALCSETENKMSWQTKHLHFLGQNIWVDWTIERNDLGNDQREDVAPHLGALWGSGEQRVKTHWHPTSVKASGNFWPAQRCLLLCCESKRWLVCHDSLFSVLLHSVILTKEAYSLFDKLLGLDICKWIPL